MKSMLLALAGALLLPAQALPQAPRVVSLTQVPCQFLESEHGKNRGYKSLKAADCEAINARTGEARLAAAKTLELERGRTIFRVTNRMCPTSSGSGCAAHPSSIGRGCRASRAAD
jgi:hypothetical protein